jgi:tripartite-type tricarboxylate transporter receptor subunit TctC
MRETLSSQGLEPVTGTPEQFAALIKSDLARWANVIKSAGVTAE